MANVLPSSDPDSKAPRHKHHEGMQMEYEENGHESDGSGSDSRSSRSGSSSGSDSSEPIYQLRQRRQANSYRFNEYDDLINSAIQVSKNV